MAETQDLRTTVADLDYFSGGVPPLGFFKLRVDDVLEASNSRPDGSDSDIDLIAELCVIGLAGYFEAFCKDQFAAIINIAPGTLERFSELRDCRIPTRNILYKLSSISRRLGFVIAEEHDFGTAKYVNSLFFDLINISPFSADEMAEYSEFLNDRNLLVHHGGVFTMKYAWQKFEREQIERDVHFNSLIVKKADVQRWAEFLLGIARKIAKASSKALVQFGIDNGIAFPEATKAAIEALEWEIS